MKSLLAIALFALTSTFAQAMTMSLDITPQGAGAWVTVLLDGEPLEGAVVSSEHQEKVTSGTGRVYLYHDGKSSGTMEIVATDGNGHSASAKRFISVDPE